MKRKRSKKTPADPTSLHQIVATRQIVIVAGSGGVGKTTTAAAIAMQAALNGKRAIVLTIDPARRLATSMGLKSLADEPARISPGAFPQKPQGSLDAMMLDTKRTFDRVIERYAISDESKQMIFGNRLYQQMSNMIAGSQEYMAMERLYEIYHDGQYDFIVLDTPPTRNALNFLESPQKMVDMTQNSILKWFLKPGLFVGHVGFGLFKKSAQKILNVFDQLAGFSFLHELAEMVSTMAELLGGFGDRAQQVYNLLRSQEASFILVATPEVLALQDAQYFYDKIGHYRLPFAGFIFNRVAPAYLPPETQPDEIAKRLSGLPDALQTALIGNLEDLQHLHLQHEARIKRFQTECGPNMFFTRIPCFPTDVHDMKGLAEINRYLFPES